MQLEVPRLQALKHLVRIILPTDPPQLRPILCPVPGKYVLILTRIILIEELVVQVEAPREGLGG